MGALLIWISSMAAAEIEYPALFKVYGIDPDEVLNVRRAPNTSAPIIGALNPETRNFEVIRTNPAGTWALVNVGEPSGWASLRFMRLQRKAGNGFHRYIRSCFGTEPFWNITFKDGRNAVFETPEGKLRLSLSPPANALLAGWETAVLGRSGNGLTVFSFFSKAACDDGMSDPSFGFRGSVVIRGQSPAEYVGCCTLTP